MGTFYNKVERFGKFQNRPKPSITLQGGSISLNHSHRQRDTEYKLTPNSRNRSDWMYHMIQYVNVRHQQVSDTAHTFDLNCWCYIVGVYLHSFSSKILHSFSNIWVQISMDSFFPKILFPFPPNFHTNTHKHAFLETKTTTKSILSNYKS